MKRTWCWAVGVAAVLVAAGWAMAADGTDSDAVAASETAAGATGAAVAAVAPADGKIAVVVPANKPSRPAHFNWVLTSANGAAPQMGQFACGSWWVAPAEGDDGVTLVSLGGNPEWKDRVSCDADPVTERHGLLSGENHYGNYEASENIIPKLPMTFRPAADSCVSLVAAMQRDEAATSKGGTKAIVGEVVDAYCVVTVMPKAPKDGGRNMIRPNVTGAHKEFLTWDDFDLSRLPTYEFLEGRSAESWEGVQRRWRNSVEIFGMAAEVEGKKGKTFATFSEGGRAFRSEIFFSNAYASTVAAAFNSDVLAMLSPANTLEEKKPALAAMLSYGLDIYHSRYDYGQAARKRWTSGAGQHVGEFLPAVLAAALLRDEDKANHLRMAAITNHGDDPAEVGPQELRQIKRGVTGVLLWGDGHPIMRPDNKTMVEADWRYWADFTSSKCYDSYAGKEQPNSAKGKKTATDPYGYIDGPANQPGTSYMGVTLGPMRSFASVMILIPDVRRVVNTDAPIEYVDRAIRHGLWTWPDPVAAPPTAEQDTARLWWSVEGCQEWGKTWGVRPDDVRFAIEDGKGRFKRLHGKTMGAVYESGQAKANWEKTLALYKGPKFEDNAVELGVVVGPEIRFTGGEKPEAYLFCATPEAKIHYTLDGSEPTAESPVWEGKPLSVTPTTQVRAMATLEGKKASAIRGATSAKKAE